MLIFLSPLTDVKTGLSLGGQLFSQSMRRFFPPPQLILNLHAATAHRSEPQRHAENNVLSLELTHFKGAKRGAL